MARSYTALLVAGALGVLTGGSALGAGQAAPLRGTVGPGFTITLTQAGKPVKKLKAGSYTVVVADRSSIHDFHLTGPRVNKTTSVQGTGTTTWKLALRKGTYKYVCDPHQTIMHGSFTVS